MVPSGYWLSFSLSSLTVIIKLFNLRKIVDSNHWTPYEVGSLANCWFKPLTQFSKIVPFNPMSITVTLRCDHIGRHFVGRIRFELMKPKGKGFTDLRNWPLCHLPKINTIMCYYTKESCIVQYSKPGFTL